MAVVIVAVAVGVKVADHGGQCIPHRGAVGKQARPAGGCGATQLAFSFAYFHFDLKKGLVSEIINNSNLTVARIKAILSSLTLWTSTALHAIDCNMFFMGIPTTCAAVL